MSDEAQKPTGDAHGPTPSPTPGVGLDKPTPRDQAAGERSPWAPPASDGSAEQTATADDVPLAGAGDTQVPSSGHTPASSSGDVSASPFAPVGDRSAAPGGPGETVTSNDPASWPPPSVHDQQTVTSMQGPEAPAPSPAPSPTWANPFAAPGGPTPASAPADPFAPPTGPGNSSAAPYAPPNPFAPPVGPGSPSVDPYAPPNPFAPPTGPANPSADSYAPPNPFAPPAGPAPYAQDGHVPPPPIAPDGPGQVPYGYPGAGYGQPGAAPQGYHGWPGVQPMPANGMGTAALVLGILSDLVFCLWPLAIILGVLGVIFGGIGRGKARNGAATNPGQALAGIICGAVGIALGIGMVVLLMVT
ncbi:hypothetical protein [Streptomyces sp. S.PB5]|uniref:DUF4190 domain-containing protein n=1 Tax=Streptomyces sp. S.PB5 TaxID=3020844 RepID=UPI0025B25117|nr:hypothetical protein [Streptomyces sp. S.PB5]MDN3025195.1 hypothetical protein [Streptomyces sp. S.PB5]